LEAAVELVGGAPEHCNDRDLLNTTDV